MAPDCTTSSGVQTCHPPTPFEWTRAAAGLATAAPAWRARARSSREGRYAPHQAQRTRCDHARPPPYPPGRCGAAAAAAAAGLAARGGHCVAPAPAQCAFPSQLATLSSAQPLLPRHPPPPRPRRCCSYSCWPGGAWWLLCRPRPTRIPIPAGYTELSTSPATPPPPTPQAAAVLLLRLLAWRRVVASVSPPPGAGQDTDKALRYVFVSGMPGSGPGRVFQFLTGMPVGAKVCALPAPVGTEGGAQRGCVGHAGRRAGPGAPGPHRRALRLLVSVIPEVNVLHTHAHECARTRTHIRAQTHTRTHTHTHTHTHRSPAQQPRWSFAPYSSTTAHLLCWPARRRGAQGPPPPPGLPTSATVRCPLPVPPRLPVPTSATVRCPLPWLPHEGGGMSAALRSSVRKRGALASCPLHSCQRLLGLRRNWLRRCHWGLS